MPSGRSWSRWIPAVVGVASLATAGVVTTSGTAVADVDCTTTIAQSSVKVSPTTSAMTAKGSTTISVSAVVKAPCGDPSGGDLFPTVNLTPVDFEHNVQWETGISVTALGAQQYRVSRTGKVSAAKTGNADAGTWDVTVGIVDTDDPGEYELTTYSDPVFITIRRAAALTANAAPEPVKKGKTITVTGKLTRANWDNGHTQPYAKQPVRLQFRTASGAWSTVKTVHSSGSGQVKATVKAAKDGYFRFSYGGNARTAAKVSASDYVNVT